MCFGFGIALPVPVPLRRSQRANWKCDIWQWSSRRRGMRRNTPPSLFSANTCIQPTDTSKQERAYIHPHTPHYRPPAPHLLAGQHQNPTLFSYTFTSFSIIFIIWVVVRVGRTRTTHRRPYQRFLRQTWP